MDTDELKMLEATLDTCEAELAAIAAEGRRLRAEVARPYAEGQDDTPYWEQAKELVEENERVCRRVDALHMLAFQLCHKAQWHLDNLRREMRR
jgi:hypothetical protein